MTADRGKEFACYTWVEQQGIPFYFADAYAAWQRGSNENSNGLLREFFPKKTDFGTVTADELLRALMLSQACKFAGIRYTHKALQRQDDGYDEKDTANPDVSDKLSP